MAEVLSQTEVESLLAALEPNSGGNSGASRPASSPQPGGQISIYDFKRPERVSKDQMRAIQALHEGFGRELGAALSGMLRNIVEVKLISVDQLTYSEFVFSLEIPTCFNLMQSEGLNGHIILDLNPSVIFPILDRLLGGGKGSTGSPPRRPLTEIELRLVSRISDLAIKALEQAWSNICALQLRVAQVESNPQLVQIVPPNEVVVLVSFEISMGEVRGVMNLCIPFNTIEPLAGKLSSNTWSAYTKRVVDERQELNLETGVSQAGVKLRVQLAESTLTAAELMNLAVGDVIMTEVPHNRPAVIIVEDETLFKARVGVLKDHKAVQITEHILRPKDVIEQKLKLSEASKK